MNSTNYFLVSEHVKRYVSLAVSLIAALILIAFLFPAHHMPIAGLDPSWVLSMNEATGRRLAAGIEVVFTYGPFGGFLTQQYHPTTNALTVFLGVFVSAFFVLALSLVNVKRQPFWLLFFVGSITCLGVSREQALMVPALLAAVFVLRIRAADPSAPVRAAWPMYGGLICIATYLGFLLFTKGNLLFFSVALVLICSVALLAKANCRMAVLFFSSVVVAAAIFWMLSGQKLGSLPPFFVGSAQIVSGYGDAMSLTGSTTEIFVYCLAAIVAVAGVAFSDEQDLVTRFGIVVAFALFLFICFKGAFVRHDGHAMYGAHALILAALLTRIWRSPRFATATWVLCLLGWALIDQSYAKSSTETLFKSIKNTVSSAYSNVALRTANTEELDKRYEAALAAIRTSSPLPKLLGSTDLYPSDQAQLIASALDWNPRPIFQSYAAYNPFLASKNRDHLRGSNAPDNLVFRIEPIDNRLPATEDGLSWPDLLRRYKPTDWVGNDLLLRRQITVTDNVERREISRQVGKLGELVAVPADASKVFATILMTKTLLGNARSTILKAHHVLITISPVNGRTAQYRLIPGLAEAGFLISPLVSNTADFAKLFGSDGYQRGKQVASFKIDVPESVFADWERDFQVTFYALEQSNAYDVSALLKLTSVPAPSESKSNVTRRNCEGALDAINDVHPIPPTSDTYGILQAQGWVTPDVAAGQPAESVILLLTDSRNNQSIVNASRVPRPDVAAFLKKSGLDQSGFLVNAEVSALKGLYKLEVGFRQKEKLFVCDNLSRSIAVK